MNIELFERLCRDSIAVDGCFLWKLSLSTRGGGGVVWWNGKTQQVRRLALQLAGRQADGNVSPSCGNQSCWNPDHLGATARTPAEVCAHVLSRVRQINTCSWWQGAKDRDGYGQVGVGGKMVMVHRLVYEQLVGPIPEGLHIDHLCYNPACVNIEHLEPVTQAENNRRAAARRRALAEATIMDKA